MQEYILKVSAQDALRRLDQFLREFFENKNLGLSRTFIQKLIRGGRVTRENKPLKPHYQLKIGDELRVLLEDKKKDMLIPKDLPLKIIYEDQDLAVINKDSGLVVHPGAGNHDYTLVNLLVHHFKNLSDIHPHRPGIVHRLDKETSGLLVIAKNNFTHLALSRQFAQHSIKRKYLALVKDKVEFDENVIEVPIGRHPKRTKSMSAGFGKKTKYAKTYYRTLKRTSTFSFLELEPFTGRTHQIRVHLAFLGHPILGDKKYGKDNTFSRLALHAEYLGFIHPRTGKFIEFSCALPDEFKEFIQKNT